jgi:hypothetical protein
MNVNLSKFSLADTTPQQVVGVLKGTGSSDADVLFAAKEEFGSTFATQRFQGLGLLITGALSCLTIVLAIIGVPVACSDGGSGRRGRETWQRWKRRTPTISPRCTRRQHPSRPNQFRVRIAPSVTCDRAYVAWLEFELTTFVHR